MVPRGDDRDRNERQQALAEDAEGALRQDCIELLVDANGACAERPHSVARIMEAFETCRAMLAPAWLNCTRQIFLGSVRQGLADLGCMDYAGNHDEEFKKLVD